MSSRYDTRTTTYSPDGLLMQVQYALSAVRQGQAVVGLTTPEGIALIAEKSAPHPLFDGEGEQLKNISGEKAFRIANHVGCCVAGVNSDAHVLINLARMMAHRHEYTFQEPIAVEDLCRVLCDEKQLYTQYGGLRPFGVSFLMAGWDRYFGYQLFSTEPSGDYNAWSAYAIGRKDELALSLLKKDFKEGMTLDEAMVFGLRVLAKTMDVLQLPKERVEVAVLKKVPSPKSTVILNHYAPVTETEPSFFLLTEEEVEPLLAAAAKEQQAEEQAEAEREREREQNLGN